MAKQEAESTNSLSIFWLKKHDYLNKNYYSRSGGITWTYGGSGRKNSINFSVIKRDCGTAYESAYIELRYTITDNFTGEKTDVNYKVPLTTTRCHYGGLRYWFLCPLSRGGRYCGKRVGVIYGNAGEYFGCRKCANIAYEAQMRGGRFRGGSVTFSDIERLEKEIKRYYYNGRPTRKYKRLMRMNNKLTRNARFMRRRHR